MIELKKKDINFIYKHFLICKDLKSLKIDVESKKVYLSKEDFKTLQVLKNLKKGY